MLDEIQLKVEPLIEESAKELLFEIVEIKVKRQNRNIVFDIIADKEQGGITIDECITLNKAIGNRLEEEDLIEDSYVVEVSSPGLDRPLETVNDFRRNMGRDVEIYLKEPADNKKCWTGIIVGVKENSVTIRVSSQELDILLTNIDKAIQVLPL